MIRRLMTLLMLLALAGCASTRELETVNAENVIAAVDRGDEVKITALNGFEYRFVVTKITNKALYGSDERVLYSEMKTVAVKKAGQDKAEGPGLGQQVQDFFNRIF